MTEQQLLRMAKRQLAILRLAEEVTGHVASPYRPVRAIQRLVERWLLPVAGDHLTRQPLPLLRAAGFVIDRDQRSRMGIIQRLVATKPGDR